MNIFTKGLVLALVALLAAGCSCKTKKVGMDDNIASATGDGPLTDIYFAFDSYKLDTKAKSTLDSNAAWLKEHATNKVQVEGHCDERGTNEYNMVLGANRAKAAFDYLRGAGIEASRMSTVSYGEDLPKDPAHNEVAWAKNRRDHFKVD